MNIIMRFATTCLVFGTVAGTSAFAAQISEMNGAQVVEAAQFRGGGQVGGAPAVRGGGNYGGAGIRGGGNYGGAGVRGGGNYGGAGVRGGGNYGGAGVRGGYYGGGPYYGGRGGRYYPDGRPYPGVVLYPGVLPEGYGTYPVVRCFAVDAGGNQFPGLAYDGNSAAQQALLLCQTQSNNGCQFAGCQ